jgi:hypothetical protein
MKVKYHVIIARCIEDGITMGWKRAHKHTDTPDVTAIHDAMFAELYQTMGDAFNAVMAKFDARARAEEREACARARAEERKSCAALIDKNVNLHKNLRVRVALRASADAIRARGQE